MFKVVGLMHTKILYIVAEDRKLLAYLIISIHVLSQS